MTNAQLQKIAAIYKNEKSLEAFVALMVKNDEFARTRPNTHLFMSEMYNWNRTRGEWTKNQLKYIRKNIEQQISFFVVEATADELNEMNRHATADGLQF